MAKARAIVKRRKSVQNIRKITRTMELIATARFKKALDRATEAEAYTRKIAELVADLGATAADGHAPAAGGPRAGQAVAAAGPDEQPRPGGRLQRQRPPRGATRTLQDYETDGVDARRSRSPASAGSTTCRFRGHRGRRDLHPVRGPAAVRRGRGAGRQVHRHVHPGRDRPGRRGLHAVHQRRAAGGGRRRRSCR